MSQVVRQAQIALTLIGVSGIALSFVPFTYDQVAIDALVLESILNELWLLVAPCVLLPVAVSTSCATWLTMGHLPRWMVILNFALAALAMCSILAGFGGSGVTEAEIIAMILLFVIGFVSVTWLSLRGFAARTGIHSVVAMQGVYAVLMSFWVAFAQEDFQIGAWLGIVTLLAYTAQIAMAAKNRWWVMAVVVPMAAIMSLMTMTRQFW